MALIIGPQAAQAVLVGVEYYDRAVVNPEFSGGPLWTGHVDTSANTLTILTWTELPLHGSEYWMPASLPLVWTARNAAGSIYDVPDTFDGRINNSFAFISDQTLRQMSWLQPEFSPATTTGPPVMIAARPVSFTLDTLEVRPGWGGWAYGPANATAGQFTFLTTNPFQGPGQQPYDESIMPVLPVAKDAVLSSTGATVTISLGAIASVPELSSSLLLAAAAAVALAVKLAHWVMRRTSEPC